MIEKSLNSITSLLAEQLDRTGDEPFKRSLAIRVDAWRSTLLQRSLDKHNEQRKIFLQTLWVPMTTVATYSCNIPIPSCPKSQSILPLPVPLRGTIQYDYVGGVDGHSAYREAPVGTLNFLAAGKYSKHTVYYELVNRNVTINGNAGIPMIRVDAVFDNPSEVFKYNCTARVDCDGWNRTYPVTGDILQMIIQYILQVDYNRQDIPVPQIQVP